MKAKILVVDDTNTQREFVCRVINGYLGTDDWEIVPACCEEEAQQLIAKIDALAIAIADACLTGDINNPNGLQVLFGVEQKLKRTCYRILVSSHFESLSQLLAVGSVNDFVHLRYRDSRSPVDGLQEALYRAREHHEGLFSSPPLPVTLEPLG
jgi:hypothetical protein